MQLAMSKCVVLHCLQGVLRCTIQHRAATQQRNDDHNNHSHPWCQLWCSEDPDGPTLLTAAGEWLINSVLALLAFATSLTLSKYYRQARQNRRQTYGAQRRSFVCWGQPTMYDTDIGVAVWTFGWQQLERTGKRAPCTVHTPTCPRSLCLAALRNKQ